MISSEQSTNAEASPVQDDIGTAGRIALGLVKVLRYAEDWVGGFTTALIDSGFVALLVLATLDHTLAPGGVAVYKAAVIVAVTIPVGLSLRHLCWLWDEARHYSSPLALAVAARQRPPWMLIRPIISAFWLVYFVAGCFFAVSSEIASKEQLPRMGAILMTFLSLYAANGYLLLAISAWTHRRKTLEWIWRWRLVLDLLVLALATCGARLFR